MRAVVVAAAACAVVAAGAGSALPATPPTFTANSTVDAPDANLSDGLCLTAAGDCTLRAAVQQANASGGATILLVDGATYTLTRPTSGSAFDAATGDLNIAAPVTIKPIGSGRVTVQGGPGWATDIFEDGLPAVVTLTRLDIKNGHVSGNQAGGAVANDVGGVLTLDDCTVTGSSAGEGGGVWNNNHLTITSSTISGNTASGAGGGVASNGQLLVSNSTISGNSAQLGGGVFVDASPLANSLSGVTVSGNSASEAGGGLYVGGAVSLGASTVSGNTAGTDGGGVYVEASSAAQLTATNATIANNRAARSGGGIDVLHSVTLNSDTIAGNTADSDAGGSGDGGGIANVSGGTVSMRNSILANNVDSTPGGGFPDCIGSISSGGYDLIESTAGCSVTGSTATNVTGVDPRLGALADNGGPTQTEALNTGFFVIFNGASHYIPPSVAIDAGDPTTACPVSSGDGVARPRDGNADTVARCDMGAFELLPGSTNVGTWALDPADAAVRGARPFGYTLSWTVPPPAGWRTLDTLNLILRDDAGTALWLRFHEVTGTNGFFSVVDPVSGRVGPEFAPGSHVRLDGGDVAVDLAKTSVDGPPGAPTVTLHLTLQLQHAATGRRLQVLVGATDDAGELQGPHPVGTLAVG